MTLSGAAWLVAVLQGISQTPVYDLVIARGRFDLRPGRVAVNPATGRGHLITEQDLERAAGWVKAGARVQRPHAETCPHRDRTPAGPLTGRVREAG